MKTTDKITKGQEKSFPEAKARRTLKVEKGQPGPSAAAVGVSPGAERSGGSPAVAGRRPEGPEPILDRDIPISRQGEKYCLTKGRCRKQWCPNCGDLSDPIAQMLTMDPKRVRAVTLTVDPSLYKDGYEAFTSIQQKGRLSQFIRDVGRSLASCGIQITNYVWFLEWHRNGFPHWHLFIEVNRVGRKGMLGADRIRHYWPYARIVRESWIRNKKHWDRLTGYVQKNGYLEKGKGHQIQLPEWTDKLAKAPRRYGMMQGKQKKVFCTGSRELTKKVDRIIKRESETDREKARRLGDEFVKYLQAIPPRTQVQKCGKWIKAFADSFHRVKVGIYQFPYKAAIGLGRYMPGVGIQITGEQLEMLDQWQLSIEGVTV